MVEVQPGDLIYVDLRFPASHLFPIMHVGLFIDEDHLYEFSVPEEGMIPEGEGLQSFIKDPFRTISLSKNCSMIIRTSLKEFLSHSAPRFVRRFPAELIRSPAELLEIAEELLVRPPTYNLSSSNCEHFSLSLVMKTPEIALGQIDLVLPGICRESIYRQFLDFFTKIGMEVKSSIVTCYLGRRFTTESPTDSALGCLEKKFFKHPSYPMLLELTNLVRQEMMEEFSNDRSFPSHIFSLE